MPATVTLEKLFDDGVSPEVALAHPELTRSIRITDRDELTPKLAACKHLRILMIDKDIARLPAFVTKFEHLRTLTVASRSLTALPSALSKLRHLRRLQVCRARQMTKVPASVWALPHLTDLELIDTGVTRIRGWEHAASLRSLVVHGSPVAHDLDDIVAGHPDAERTTGLDGIALEPEPSEAKLPRGKKKLAEALQDDLLSFDADLSGRDLSGITFEGLALDQHRSLANANLSNTIWKRCHLRHAQLRGANLEGAVFEECVLQQSDMERVKARGAVFRRCHLNGLIAKGDLRGVRFERCDPDSLFSIKGSRANKAVFQLRATSPTKGNFIFVDETDLRGASISFELTEEAARRIGKKKSKPKWKTVDLSGARVDAKTTLTYAEEPSHQGASRPVEGPVATPIGTLSASNSGLWCVIADARDANGWGGSILSEGYEEDPESDFSRALELDSLPTKKRELTVGPGVGVVAQVGGCGQSNIWRLADGSIALLEFYAGEDTLPKDVPEQIGASVAQLPTKGRPHRLGQLDVRCGCIALMLPYAKARFTDKQIASAAVGTKAKVGKTGDRALVPMKNGRYQVRWEHLGHDGELGNFEGRLRITAVAGKRLEKAKPSTKAGRKPKASHYLEFREGSSRKFWESTIKGKQLTVRYGRIGSDGRTLVKAHESAKEARAAQAKLVKQKGAKGYHPA